MTTFIVTAIKMKSGCTYSNSLLEIDQIYLSNSKDGWYKKATIHDYVKNNPKSITVRTSSGPYVVPAVSSNGEKYVKSSPNNTMMDNLLSLPRK